jgi:hypothetical protein
MESNETRLAKLEARMDAAEKNAPTTATSSIAKKAENPMVPTPEELKAKTLEVTYNANANKPTADKKPTKGTFYFKHPTVRDPESKEVMPAFEAITNEAIVIWFVENTWVGNKVNSPFIGEVV